MSSTNKYDRQLRLWGAAGQKALSECRIVLFGAGPIGTEALKNLVLPGVGHVTIVDDARVTPTDVANNFFVGPGDEGRPLAEVRGGARARASSSGFASARGVRGVSRVAPSRHRAHPRAPPLVRPPRRRRSRGCSS